MKKIIVLVITLIFITGCGNKIVCRTNNDNSVSEIYEISYVDDNVTDIINRKIYRFDNKEEFNNFENLMNYKVESNGNNNVKISYKKKNKKYILISEYDVDLLSDQQLKQFGLSRSLSDLKGSLMEYGLSCK
ncbi:MAG: hypothetical protein J6D28_04705 [Bacilli bacterium]|nr:hypothetical protein [Bacilli bacterium]